MRLHFTNDDGELLTTWTVPDTVTADDIESIIEDGLWRKHRLDRCGECGRFVPGDALVERHEAQGAEILCSACAAADQHP